MCVIYVCVCCIRRGRGYSVLLVVVAVVDDDEAQVEALAQVEQVIRLCFSPAVVVQVHLVLLLRVHGDLYRLTEKHTQSKSEPLHTRTWRSCYTS